MKRILYRKDGSIGVITPALKSKRENETESQWLKRVFNKATPDGIEFKDTNEVLPDRRFRNAWGKGITKIVEVDLSKAKVQVMSELRTARNKELVETDSLMARANEIGTQEETNALKVYRQRLRDLPTNVGIDTITSSKELQNKYPETVTIENLKL